ncbi:hypothetical protein GQR58_030619 [Nymphon striatum]|nr:hypothetical protein GQR58_030619 [Nymphon striatum]
MIPQKCLMKSSASPAFLVPTYVALPTWTTVGFMPVVMNDTGLVIPYAIKAGLGEYARNQMLIIRNRLTSLPLNQLFTFNFPKMQSAIPNPTTDGGRNEHLVRPICMESDVKSDELFKLRQRITLSHRCRGQQRLHVPAHQFEQQRLTHRLAQLQMPNIPRLFRLNRFWRAQPGALPRLQPFWARRASASTACANTRMKILRPPNDCRNSCQRCTPACCSATTTNGAAQPKQASPIFYTRDEMVTEDVIFAATARNGLDDHRDNYHAFQDRLCAADQLPHTSRERLIILSAGADVAFLEVEASLTGRRWVGPGVERTELPQAVCQVLARRGVVPEDAEAFLAPALRDLLPDPRSLKDMEVAATRFLAAAGPFGAAAPAPRYVFADMKILFAKRQHEHRRTAPPPLTWLPQAGSYWLENQRPGNLTRLFGSRNKAVFFAHSFLSIQKFKTIKGGDHHANASNLSPQAAPQRHPVQRSCRARQLVETSRRHTPALWQTCQRRGMTYQGIVTGMKMNWLGRMLAQGARLIGAPLPYDPSCVDQPAVVVVTEDIAGNGQFWIRQYGRKSGFPQVVHSSKRFAGPTGLEEYIGFGIGMALKVEVAPAALMFKSDHYFLSLFGRRFRIPRILSPVALVIGHHDLGDGAFRFSMRLHAGAFGEVLSQDAVFQDAKRHGDLGFRQPLRAV